MFIAYQVSAGKTDIIVTMKIAEVQVCRNFSPEGKERRRYSFPMTW
jgi:hypothetical protein